MKDARPVVLYSEDNCSALVLLLDGEGPKFYRGRPIHLAAVFLPLNDDMDTGTGTNTAPSSTKETIGGEWKYEKARYRIIAEGKRFDLVKRIREAHSRYQEESRKHDGARSRAESDARTVFREQWLVTHPYPKWPGVEAILKEEQE